MYNIYPKHSIIKTVILWSEISKRLNNYKTSNITLTKFYYEILLM